MNFTLILVITITRSEFWVSCSKTGTRGWWTCDTNLEHCLDSAYPRCISVQDRYYMHEVTKPNTDIHHAVSWRENRAKNAKPQACGIYHAKLSGLVPMVYTNENRYHWKLSICLIIFSIHGDNMHMDCKFDIIQNWWNYCVCIVEIRRYNTPLHKFFFTACIPCIQWSTIV